MFSKDSMLKDINIISKFISLVIILSTIIIVNNNIVLLIISFLFLILARFNILSIISFIISLLNMFLDVNVIVKIMSIIVYIDLFRKIIDFNEYKALIEDMFYKSNSKIIYKLLSIYYFILNFRNNLNKMYLLTKEYGIKINFKVIKFILKESYQKTNEYVNKIMLNYKYRFYGLYNKRSYYEKDKMDSYDYKYILIHVIILFISYVYWR